MIIPKRYLLVCAILISGLLAGCASNSDNEQESLTKIDQQAQGRSDPLEGFNRAMFNINYNYLDPYILRPVAVAWRNYVPKPIRIGLINFSNNLGEPASMVNNLLKGEPRLAAMNFSRFLINSTLGIGGLVDVASETFDEEIYKKPTVRFGSVLGHYGVGYGPYVVLPVYNSATPREDIGGMVDTLYPAYSWLGWPMVGLFVFDTIEARSQVLDQDQLLKDSADPYVFMREAYFQNKDFQAAGGAIVTSNNPNASVIEDSLDEIDDLN